MRKHRASQTFLARKREKARLKKLKRLEHKRQYKLQMQNDTNLCIPSIEASIKKSLIFEKFKQLNWGFITNILEIPILKDSERKRIVVFLKRL